MKRVAVLALSCMLLSCESSTGPPTRVRGGILGTYRLVDINGSPLPRPVRDRDTGASYTVHGSELQMFDEEYAVTADHTDERTGERRTLTVRGRWRRYGTELRFQSAGDSCEDRARWYPETSHIAFLSDCSYNRSWGYER